jgi:hypothetical protein
MVARVTTTRLSTKRLTAFSFAGLIVGAQAVSLMVPSQPALAQAMSADGWRVGPSLDDVRRKRQEDQAKAEERLKQNSAANTSARQATMADMFPSISLGVLTPQPISLEGVTIPGLTPRAVDTLANNQLAVLYGPNFVYPTMAELYRENRITGRSNFVSADVITHIYYVLINTVFIKVIENTLYPELETLLKDLAESCVHDYRACDLPEVKDDIQRNLAFVIVGMRLLDPKAELPDMGGASDLAKTEMAAIAKGGKGHSVIFNRDQDFAIYRPIGFYAATARATCFYRAVAWLSAMYFPLTDVTNNSETGGGNTFRRAVLLYRALELGKAKDNATLLSHWQRIVDIYSLVSQGRLTREPSVYPRDLRAMFSTAAKLEFKDLLYTLGQPLSRARLLISIKNQRQMGLNAVSILEIDRPKESDTSTLAFRFFPPVTPYELDWLRYVVKDFRDDGTAGENYANPLSLYIMYAWGAPQATNILHNMAERLDPSLSYGLSEMVRNEGKRQKHADANLDFAYPERRWSLISDYFIPVKKGGQAILYSDPWMTQRLNSASGALVDSIVAIDKSYKTELVPSKTLSGGIAPGSKTATTTGTLETTTPVKAPEPPPVKGSKIPIFHYLEPAPDYYRMLSTYVSDNENELQKFGAFPESERSKLSDLKRLLDRLAKICDRECALEPLPAADFHLLANFDQVLAGVDSPLAGTVYVPGISGGGASLGLGNAAPCYVIFNTDKGPYLSRGAVYSYYEVGGGPFKMEHWERKRAFGFLRPVSWLNQFNVVQEGETVKAGGKADAADEASVKKDPSQVIGPPAPPRPAGGTVPTGAPPSSSSSSSNSSSSSSSSSQSGSSLKLPGALPTLKVK